MLLLRTAAPCRDERDEIDERRDAPLPETLARDEARFELGGIEPARVLGRVVQHEAAPQPPPLKLSEDGLDRATEVDVEIVHDKVNPARRAIALGDLSQRPHECGSLAVRRREGQAAPGQRLHDAEDVCGPAPDVLVIGASQLARRHRLAAPRVFPENDGPLIQADDRLVGIELTSVEPEHVLHAVDELAADFRHAPHFFPATA